jgi:uncharacterized protein
LVGETAALRAIADLVGSVDDLPADLSARKKPICGRHPMARNALVDSGFVVALLSRRDNHHEWAVAQANEFPPPWPTCEAALSEAFHLLGTVGTPGLAALLHRGAVHISFAFAHDQEPVLTLMRKYSDVPMSLADACLVRMTETLADSLLLSTDSDFHIYRRHSRQVIPP